ncbi:MAG: type IV pilus biogenesis protein PilM [Candidatus Dormibacteria bacterium]
MPDPIAIDLSDSSIRLLAGSFGGPMRFIEADAPDGTLDQGRVADPARLGVAIRDLIEAAGIAPGEARIGAGDALASFRVLTMTDKVDARRVEAAVQREIPLRDGRTVLHWARLGTDAKERRIYAVVSDRPRVESLADAVLSGGLRPSGVELKSMCLARASGISDGVVLDLRPGQADAVFVADSLPQLWHRFPLPAPEEPGLEAAVGAGLAAGYSFRRRVAGTDDSGKPVVVTGDYSPDPAVLALLSDAVGHPVQNAIRPARVSEEVPFARFMVAIGLLMKRR